eukprot:GHVU01004332.1.p1 GENE.GHVU01004332.1~~GHVU01004332.1.p1  ORF type:complete len:120 (+),score=2.03 GHVU01004332.1:444-803(+)
MTHNGQRTGSRPTRCICCIPHCQSINNAITAITSGYLEGPSRCSIIELRSVVPRVHRPTANKKKLTSAHYYSSSICPDLPVYYCHPTVLLCVRGAHAALRKKRKVAEKDISDVAAEAER